MPDGHLESLHHATIADTRPESSTETASTYAEVLSLLARSDAAGHRYLRADGTARDFTFRELVAGVDDTARRLLSLGLIPGDRFGIVLIDPCAFVRVFLAGVRVGLVPVPMFPPLGTARLDAFIENSKRML